MGWSSVTLIRSEKQNILFDAGSYNDRPVLLDALKRFELSTNDIDGIVLSHLHFDHAANVELFPNAWVAVHESELAQFPGDPATPFYIVEGIKKHPRLRLVKEDAELLPCCRVLETPGHSKGSISLLCDFAGARYMMVGDAIKNLHELNLGQVDGAWDRERAKATIALIREQADIIIPGHDAYLKMDEGIGKRLNSPSEWVTIVGTDRNYLLEVESEVK